MNNKNNNDSLKRSHSVLSNGKLTFLCIFSSICLTCLFVSLGYYFKTNNSIFLYASIGLGVLTLLDFVLFSKFKR